MTIYTAVPPGRGGEFWRLLWGASANEHPSKERPNLLVVSPVHGATLRLSDHKTSKGSGMSEVPLPATAFDTLIAATLELRAHLLQKQQHSFVFCRADGAPYVSSDRWALYLQSTFGRGLEATRVHLRGEDVGEHVGFKVSVNGLRKGEPVLVQPPYLVFRIS